MAVTYDPTDYVTAATNLANNMQGKGESQWNTLSGAMAKNMATANDVSSAAGQAGSMWGGQAKKMLDFYNTGYVPAMQQQLDFAKNYASPERMAFNRGQAVSGVTQGVNAGLENDKARLAAYGVRDPSGGRAQGAQRAALVGGGAAAGAAGTQSDVQTEMLGQNLLGGAINTGLNVGNQAAQGTGVQLAAQNQQVNAPLAAASTQAQTMGTPVQWYGMAGQELSEWPKAEQAQANLLQKQDEMQAQGGDATMNMIMGGLGALNGGFSGGGQGGLMNLASTFGPMLAMSGGRMPAFADGGMMDDNMAMASGAIDTNPSAVSDIPVAGEGASGDVVPYSASPSRGAIQDDVNARVGPGEFVLPERTTSWYGEKFIQKLIEKADKERGTQTQAAPKLSRLPPTQKGMPPTFVSPSQQGAPT